MTMKLVLTTLLLWAIYGCSDDIVAAAFNADVRPVVSLLRSRSSMMASCATATSHHRCRRHHPHDVAGLSMSQDNEFDTQYSVNDFDSRGKRQILSAVCDMSRRGALARIVAASATPFLGAFPSMADDDSPTTAFSESPTSDASIARSGYEGKIAIPAEKPPALSSPSLETEAPPATNTVTPPVEAPSSPPAAPAREAAIAKSTSLEPKFVLPLSGDLSPDFAIATAAFVGLAFIANNIQEDSDLGATASAPPAQPYGLSGGRNNPIDEGATKEVKQLQTVAATLPPPPPPKPEKKKWQAEKPIPYGIQNPNGKNPFLKEILDYCEGGKVTEKCTETIKDYLDNLADSGAVATSNEVKAIVGYLDSLGSKTSAIGEKKKVGAAFTSYLDALSAGSAPPPSSAQAVKTYLDTLNGAVPARMLVTSPAIPSSSQPPPPSSAPLPVASTTSTPDFAQYDNRLTSIEGRVASLETKVDRLPDQVFEKIEAWQTKYEARMSEEVKKIVRAMQGPPVEPVVIASAPPSLEPSVREVPNARYVTQSESFGAISEGLGMKSVIVDYPSPSPLPAIPERPGVPRPGASSSSVPKKYGISSGGQGWKTGKPKSGGGGYLDNMNAGGLTSPSSAPTSVSSPAVPKTPEASASPPGPKTYGISGGRQKWKTGKPMKGGGYLDNMS